MLFFTSVGTAGVTRITRKPSIKLLAVVGNSSGVRKLPLISPALLSSGPFSDTTAKTFVLYPATLDGLVEVPGTIDQHETFPVEHLQGHIYFEIPILTGEYLISAIMVAIDNS